jgi:glycosyltransferase involved in cell wall biosynthesis
MKILYICHESLPSPHTNTEQAVKSAAALVEEGVQVRLVSPGRKRDQKSGKDRFDEIAAFYGINSDVFQKGLELKELPPPFFLTGKAVCIWHDFKAARYAGKWDQDLIYTRDTVSLLAALTTGKKVLFETYRYDFNTRARFYWWRSICYSRENLVGIITHSQFSRASFLQAGVHPDIVTVIYNAGFTTAGFMTLSRESTRSRIGLPQERQIVMYTGNIGPSKGLEILLPLAKLLPEALFVLVGGVPGSSFVQRMEQQIRDGKLVNIFILPRVLPAELELYLRAADCLILPPSARPLHAGRTVLPLKTFQYLHAGRPILGPDTPDIREVLKHRHNAVLVSPDSPEDAAQALRDLWADKDLQDHLSRNAVADAEKFTWQKRAKKIKEFISSRM